MRYEVKHPAFVKRQLSVETTGKLIIVPRLFVNGEPATSVPGKYNHYLLASDAGVDTAIRFKTRYPDPIPKLMVGNDEIDLVPALQWYEYAWILLPYGLVTIGGAVGGLCGFLAVAANSRILRSERGALVRYLQSLMVTIVAVFVWLVIAVMIRMLIGAPHK